MPVQAPAPAAPQFSNIAKFCAEHLYGSFDKIATASEGSSKDAITIDDLCAIRTRKDIPPDAQRAALKIRFRIGTRKPLFTILSTAAALAAGREPTAAEVGAISVFDLRTVLETKA